MTVKFTNNASSTLSSGINSSVTSLTVASASAFPQLAGADDYCYLTIQQATGTVREVVKATALSSNTFTIIRAQDNTTAQSFSAGDTVELRMTAALLTDVIDAATVEGVKTNFQYTPTAGQTVFSGADNSSNTMIINQSGLVNVYMNGVRLVQGTDYTVSAANNTITLTTGATTADIIDIEVYGNFTGQSGAAVAITGGSITGTAITATTLGASSTATLNTFVSSNATISGGTINNVAIGGTTQAAGNFTDITGSTATLTTAGNTTQLTLKSTDPDSAVGPRLDLTRDSASPADGDAVGQIRFLADNDAGEELSFGFIRMFLSDVSDGAEGSRLEIDTRVNGTNRNRLHIDSAETVFNEDSVDLDFRVESNNKQGMFIVDAGDDVIKVGGITGGASGTLKVKSNSSHHAIALEEHSGSENYSLGVVADGSLIFANSGTEVVRFSDSGTVGIGRTPASTVMLDITEDDSATDLIIGLTAGTGGRAQIRSVAQSDGTSSALSFHTMTGSNTSEAARISPSGTLGIGTVSPAQKVHASSTGITFFRATGGSGNTGFDFGQHSNNNGYLWLRDNQSILIGVNNSEVARFDTSGHLGLGQSSPATQLDVNGGLHGDHATFTSVAGRGLKISTESRAGQNDGIGVIDAQDSEGDKGIISLQSGGTETARVTTSQILIGQTSGSAANVGVIFQKTGNIFATADGGTSGYFRRNSNNGEILRFSKNTTTVGSIGVNNTALFISSPTGNDSGLKFGDRQLVPCTTAGASRDDAINLGSSSNRFDTIFAKSSTINTSDRNEKQDIELLSDAEMRVAKAAKGLLRKYRWKSSVAEKGDEARIHFGIIAQDLQAAFEAEGLDAGRYGMWCSDTWTDEETGEEHTRLGVRYSELLAFIIAVI